MNLIYILLVLLVVTRICAVIAQKAGQPPLMGEILGGIFLGVVIGQFSGFLPVLSTLPHSEVLKSIADLGVFFLMLLAGLELRPKEFAQSSRRAFWIALGGFFVPLASGAALAWVFIPASDYKVAHVLFVGAALAITAVPVAVKVLVDLGALNSSIGRSIVSAAVFDDVFSLILLAVLIGVINTGEAPAFADLGILSVKIAAFFALSAGCGMYLFPMLGRWLVKTPVEELEFSGLVAAALAYALLAELLGLHFIIGAFLAGLFFSRRVMDEKTFDDVESKIKGITNGFLAPIFFATIGLHLDLAALSAAPWFLISLIAVAFLGKFAGAGVVARYSGFSAKGAAAIGAAMSARGAVELIIADVALQAGLFEKPDPTPAIISSLFSSIVIVAIVTTLLAPIIMHAMLGRGEADRSPG